MLLILLYRKVNSELPSFAHTRRTHVLATLCMCVIITVMTVNKAELYELYNFFFTSHIVFRDTRTYTTYTFAKLVYVCSAANQINCFKMYNNDDHTLCDQW